jgi:hypothetical protein
MRAKGDTDRHDDDESWKVEKRQMKVACEGSGVWGGAVAWLLGGRHVRPCDSRSDHNTRLENICISLWISVYRWTYYYEDSSFPRINLINI